MNLDDWRGWMKGEDCVVVGCGPSAGLPFGDTDPYQDSWTIGCNRSAQFCWPDFVLCVEPARDKGLWGLIKSWSPLVIFSHIDPGHPRVVQIGTKDVREWLEPDERIKAIEAAPLKTEPVFDSSSGKLLGHFWNEGIPAGSIRCPLRLSQSPFFAAAVALHLGFETVGLIGVDYTEDRYPRIDKENEAWRRLLEIAAARDQRIVNLNPASRLETIPKTSWSEVRTK